MINNLKIKEKKWQIRLSFAKIAERHSSSRKKNRNSTKKRDLKTNLRDAPAAERQRNSREDRKDPAKKLCIPLYARNAAKRQQSPSNPAEINPYIARNATRH
jgi:hypothetical protein